MYLWLKFLHVLAVVMFLGNIVTGGFWHRHALRTRDPNGDAPFRKALEIIGRLSNAEDRGRTLFAALESLSAVNDVRAGRP